MSRAPGAGPSDGESATVTPLASHLGALVDKRLRKLQGSREFSSAGDPVEAVHDLRVSSRRLRAFVDVFESRLDTTTYADAKKALRRITRAAGELRDLDVQAGLFEDRLARSVSDVERAALEVLLDGIWEQRQDVERRTRRKLRKVDPRRLQDAMGAALDGLVGRLPATEAATTGLARELLETYVSAAEADAPAPDAPEDPGAIHAFRVRIKRLRYALELFEPVLGDAYGEIYSGVEGLQTRLGKHHDLVVLTDLVHARRSELESRGRRTLASGLTKLEDALNAERAEVLQGYHAAPFDGAWCRAKIDAALELDR